MPICPFIKGDLDTGNIKFMIYNSEMDKKLIELIREWRESSFKTGLILHIGDDMETINKRKWVKFLNNEIQKDMDDIKLLAFSPFEDFKISNVSTRKKAPCMLYNLAKKKDLNEAAKKLLKTKWYDNLITEDYKRLNIKKTK